MLAFRLLIGQSRLSRLASFLAIGALTSSFRHYQQLSDSPSFTLSWYYWLIPFYYLTIILLLFFYPLTDFIFLSTILPEEFYYNNGQINTLYSTLWRCPAPLYLRLFLSKNIHYIPSNIHSAYLYSLTWNSSTGFSTSYN